MRISVVNHTNGKLSDEKVQEGIRAVNRQLAHDFTPNWHVSADLRLEGATGPRPAGVRLSELRGDAIIYLWDKVNVDDAIGFHERNAQGIPFGFVFTELAKALDEPWTVTLSHEALELVGDPEVNLLVAGPHPADPSSEVFHWYEMCDAVQDERYKVDGIWVSNFLLPLYFTADQERGGRNDFLGRVNRKTKQPLQSFGINPGGYIGFYNPKTGKDETVALDGDKVAKQRLQIKSRAAITRRSKRYKLGTLAAGAVAGMARRAKGMRNLRVDALPVTRQALAVQMLDSSTDRTAARRG